MLATRNGLATLATSVAGLLAVLIAWAAVGERGPLSAALGAAGVLAFFLIGTLPFLVVGSGGSGRSALGFLVLGVLYVLRILAGVVVWALAVDAPSLDRVVVGVTVIGCALVWVNTQVVVGLSRRHQPTLEV